ncbi:MAG: hypothetical protein Q8N23_28885 [Archangium sp.]|nr:hypothetical protein [Archangium sp.]MDP3156722.1 hypothetical protein [Archangium sp.]MDP3574660.1 hypothetical protein [Archangium sp.]
MPVSKLAPSPKPTTLSNPRAPSKASTPAAAKEPTANGWAARAGGASQRTQAQVNAEQALTFGHHRISPDGWNKLPTQIKELTDAVTKVANYTSSRAATLGLVNGRSNDAPQLAPSELPAELARIAGGDAPQVLLTAAGRRGVDAQTSARLRELSSTLSSLKSDPAYKSAVALERTPMPKLARGPSAAEQRAAIERADKEKPIATPEREGRDWNWSDGNRPSQASTSLFVRK